MGLPPITVLDVVAILFMPTWENNDIIIYPKICKRKIVLNLKCLSYMKDTEP
jgi:hypothetical protein